MQPRVFLLFDFDNSYSRLPERFYRRQDPVPVARPGLVALNHELALDLRMGEGHSQEALAAVCVGNVVAESAAPLAMAYAGHQFGHFVPELGDGRALLLGEVLDRRGVRRDIQLKGSGRTPFSRNGDGRAALGPVMREYIVSEAMHALGIPTTRSLAIVTTGEPVLRETALPGAVLMRVARSHIRIGSFEYFAARADGEAVRMLADYTIARLYPEAGEEANPYLSLLERAIGAQAVLVAGWMQVGFIHGVMNTDNVALSGETLDYGPCAFMDHYNPAQVFSAIDRQGRYAFANQPAIAQWNLARLAEALLPLLAQDSDKAVKMAEQALAAFPALLRRRWLAAMRGKLGLFTEDEGDPALIESLLSRMHQDAADYTRTFRLLSTAAEEKRAGKSLTAMFAEGDAFARWLEEWRERLKREPLPAGERGRRMQRINPARIPRNHKVEEAIEAAVARDDFSGMERLIRALSRPFEEREEFAPYDIPPLPEQRVQKTFCGT